MGKILISAVESGECQIELFKKKRKLTQLLPPSCPLFFIFFFHFFHFFILLCFLSYSLFLVCCLSV